MATKLELQSKNRPTTLPKYKFELDSCLYGKVSLNLLDITEFAGNSSGFDIHIPGGDTYSFWFETISTSTNQTIYDSLYMFIAPNYTPIVPMSTDYFDVVFENGMTTIKWKAHGYSQVYAHFNAQAMVQLVTPDIPPIELKFAPDGWEQDEYAMERDMESFGVFRKFTVKELKFVKDGRDYLKVAYERGGVNTQCIFIVTEHTASGITRNRFTGRIDFGTYKITKLSVDVEVIDGAFTDLILGRAKSTVNLFADKSIDGKTISGINGQLVTLPDINIVQVASWAGFDYTTVYPGVHYLFVNVLSSEYAEANSVVMFGSNFFVNAVEQYIDSNFNFKIKAILKGNGPSANFNWVYYISKWVGGTETVIYTDSYNHSGDTELEINIDKTEVFTINAGESFSFRANIINTSGAGSIRFEDIAFNLSTQIENIASRDIFMMMCHEAFTRLVEHYTGDNNRFYSTALGRTDLGYAADGWISAITTGRYIRGNYGLNNTMPANLKEMYLAVRALKCLGMGIETINGEEKVVIEEMAHFFNNKVILNVSNRINPALITKEVYADILFNRIDVGYNAFDYNSLGGIYEFNAGSKFTTVIKPVENALNLISPIRGDMSGVLSLVTEPAANKDVSGEGELFIFDSIRAGGGYKIRTNEGFDESEDQGNRDVLFNLMLTPARNLLRWGTYIRGFIKYLDSLLIWQTSDKNTKLVSKETGQDEIAENANIAISSLSNPLWKHEIVTFEVPAYENDIELIKANPYGLIKASGDIWGWIIKYKSKNKKKKSEFTLLVCDTDFVVPDGDPVYPASITIKKVITDFPEDYKEFGITILCSNGGSYYNIPLKQQSPILLTNVPYGDYIVTETLIPDGYSLVSITPNTFTIDADNLHFDLEIVNEKTPQALELTFDDIANVPVADASDVADWNTFFDLPTNGTPFTSVEVVGDVVKLLGGSGITLKYQMFIDYHNLVRIDDKTECIIGIGNSCFAECNGLEYANLPNATSIDDNNSCFYDCYLLTYVNLSSLTVLPNDTFLSCALTQIILPSLTNMGSSVADNQCFDGITGKTITLTIPSALMTCNGGAPDGDIAYLVANNNVTIITV